MPLGSPILWPKADGQAINKADFDAYDQQLNTNLADTGGSTQSPGESTAELRAARGSTGSLSNRLATMIAANGQPGSGVVTPQMLAHLMGVNLTINDTFDLWLTDSSAPVGWELTGAGSPTIARTGAGLGDTTAPIIGRWAAKVTADAGGACYLRQKIVPAAAMARLYQLNTLYNLSTLKLPYVALLGGMKASLAADVSTYVSGVSAGEVAGAQAGGAGLWSFRGAGVAEFDCTSTDDLYVGYKVAAGKTVYLSGLSSSLLPYGVTPNMYLPAGARRKRHVIHFAGNQTTGTRKWSWTPDRPGIILSTQLAIGTAPVGSALIVDLNTWDGAALTTMYTTKPQIADGATWGVAAAPDGTYGRRVVRSGFTAITAGSLVTLDIDQVGSGTAGADLTVNINYLEYESPLEAFFDYNTLTA